jgi:hypothetical protein
VAPLGGVVEIVVAGRDVREQPGVLASQGLLPFRFTVKTSKGFARGDMGNAACS